jgi:coenzyme PQQ synthesis protein D (PqqD)
MDAQAKWKRSEQVVGTEMDGSFVIFNIEVGNYVSLNRTAHAIWELLADERTAPEIADLLVERFETTREQALVATERTLAQLATEQLAAAN